MEGNKDEGLRCLAIAEKCLADRNIEKAIKFLMKSDRLYPTKKAKDLLQKFVRSNGDAKFPQSDEASDREQVCNERNSTSTSLQQIGYTPEQLVAVKRINKCKDYYAVLSVEKDCNENDLKRAYKKLALEMHPDKNRTPGATEAFKDFVSAEDLFNMFFGGGYSSGNLRTFHANGRRFHNSNFQNNTGRSSEGNYTLILQTMPLVIVVVLSFLSNFLVSDPVYSLERTNKYPVWKETSGLHVPFYVKQDFKVEFKSDMRRIESMAEEEYVSQLRNNCWRERQRKESMLWQARNFGDAELYRQASGLKMPSCDKIQDLSR